jgi:hypothetical protein
MKLDEAVNYFGNMYRLSKECGFSLATPYSWRLRGHIPFESQYKIEKVSKGALKAKLEDSKG